MTDAQFAREPTVQDCRLSGTMIAASRAARRTQTQITAQPDSIGDRKIVSDLRFLVRYLLLLNREVQAWPDYRNCNDHTRHAYVRTYRATLRHE